MVTVWRRCRRTAPVTRISSVANVGRVKAPAKGIWIPLKLTQRVMGYSRTTRCTLIA